MNEYIEDLDIDWFAVDSNGFIGHFSTSGTGAFPNQLVAALDELEKALAFFLHTKPTSDVRVCSKAFERGAVDSDDLSRVNWFVKDYKAMGERGLYSHQAFLRSYRPTDYYLVAIPASPVHVRDIPDEIRRIVARVRLPLSFADETIVTVGTIEESS